MGTASHIPNTILRHLHLFPTSTTTSIQAANISISQQNGLTKRTSTTIRCIHSAKSHQQHQQPPSPQRKKWHPATRQKVYHTDTPASCISPQDFHTAHTDPDYMDCIRTRLLHTPDILSASAAARYTHPSHSGPCPIAA